MILGFVFIFGVVSGLMLIAYDDGVPFAIIKRLKCRAGYHQMGDKVFGTKVRRYYCRHCKVPRKHPVLKLIDGGNKMKDNEFRL